MLTRKRNTRLTSKLSWLTILFFFLCAPLKANKHEHIYSYLLPGSLQAAYESVFPDESFENLQLELLLSKDGQPRVLKQLKDLWGDKAIDQLTQQLAKDHGPDKVAEVLNHMPFKTACELLAPYVHMDARAVQQAFVTLPSAEKRGELGIRPVAGYLAREEFSKEFLQNLKSRVSETQYLNFLAEAYGHTLDQLKRKGKVPPVVEFSVGDDLFNPGALGRLKEVFKRHGSEAKFLYSYPRYKLARESEEQFSARLERIKGYLRSGTADGIDISGSLNELKFLEDELKLTSKDRADLEQLFFERLRKIADAAAERESTLKFHAFEGISGLPGIGPHGEATPEREGRPAFYGALFRLLEHLRSKKNQGKKVPAIVIGHLANLDESDIRRLAQYRKDGIPIEVDANLLSNHVLQGKTYRELARKVAFLLLNDIPVTLGGDGQAVLSNEGFQLQSLLRVLEGEFKRMQLPESTIARFLKTLENTSIATTRGNSSRPANCAEGRPCPWSCLSP